jgi:hypothetical protein
MGSALRVFCNIPETFQFNQQRVQAPFGSAKHQFEKNLYNVDNGPAHSVKEEGAVLCGAATGASGFRGGANWRSWA